MKTHKKTDLKMTPQRMAILQYLEGNKDHPSVEDIYHEIRKTFPMISLATVYKTIEVLKKRGELLELTIDSTRRRYDPDTSRHHHLVCIECGTIADVHGDIHIEFPEKQGEPFKILSSHIEFYGICEKCRPWRESNQH